VWDERDCGDAVVEVWAGAFKNLDHMGMNGATDSADTDWSVKIVINKSLVACCV
jgi:hypothetical protein